MFFDCRSRFKITLSPISLRALLPVVVVLLTSFLVASNAQPAAVTLAWDSNTEPDLAGYKIYYGGSSRNYGVTIDAGKNTTYEVTNLTPGATYYFAATAYDTDGNESDFSSEVSYTVPVPATTTSIQSTTTTIKLPTTSSVSTTTSSMSTTTVKPTTTTTLVLPSTTTSSELTTTTTAKLITSTTTSKPSKTPPNANAGNNRKIKPGTAITLNGTYSYAADGGQLQYYWRVIKNPGKYILRNKNTATPTFKPAAVGMYEIGLKVYDGTYYSEEASVTITVEIENGGGATTTTSVQYSTTTTSSPLTTTSSSTTTIMSSKVWCPFLFLTNNDPEKINKLRDFRNNVLLKTPMGREYVKLFYKNAIELITILINNQDITDQSKVVLDELLPEIKLAAKGKVIIFSPYVRSEIEGILKQISMEASIELKQAIEKLQKDLGEGKMFDELGVEVSSQNEMIDYKANNASSLVQ